MIIQTPKDYIDESTASIIGVQTISGSSIVQKYNTVGAMIEVQYLLSTPPLNAVTIEIIDENNNVVGTGIANGITTSGSVYCIPKTAGEFKPQIKGISNHKYEKLTILENTDKSIILNNKPEVTLSLKTSTTQILEQDSDDLTITTPFNLSNEIKSITVENPSDGSVENVSFMDLDDIKYDIDKEVTINYKVSNTINSEIYDKSIINSTTGGAGSPIYNNLDTVDSVSIPTLDNNTINKNELLTITPDDITTDCDKVSFVLDDASLEIEILDEDNLDEVMLSIESTQTDVSKQQISELGGTIPIKLVLTTTASEDMTVKVTLRNNITNEIIQNENKEDIIIEVLFPQGSSNVSTNLTVPNMNNIYNDEDKTVVIQVDSIEAPNTKFEKLIIDPDKKSFEYKIVDSKEVIRFNVFLQRDQSDSSKLLNRVNNVNNGVSTDNSIISDTAGPGSKGSKMPTYFMLFNEFMITTDGEPWNGIPLGSTGSNISRYLTKDDFRDTDYIKLKYTEKISLSSNFASRSRIIEIRKNHLEDFDSSYNFPGIKDAANQKMVYFMPINLWDISYDDTVSDNNVTKKDEMVNRINRIQNYDYDTYLSDGNNPMLKYSEDGVVENSNQWVSTASPDLVYLITAGEMGIISFQGEVIDHTFEGCEFVPVPTQEDFPDTDWNNDPDKWLFDPKYTNSTRAFLALFNSDPDTSVNDW